MLGAAALRGVFEGVTSLEPLDLAYLSRAGAEMLAGNLEAAFDDPGVQSGPATLLLLGGVWLVSGASIQTAILVSSLLNQVLTAAAVMLVTRLVCRSSSRDEPPYELGLGLGAVATGLTWSAHITSHPEELYIPILWALAGYAFLRGRVGLGAAGLVLAAALKPLGLVGAAMCVLVPDRKRLWAAIVSTGVGSAVIYLPMLLSGGSTAEYVWPITPRSGLAYLGFEGSFGWEWRVLQGAIVVLTGVGLARWTRADPGSWWLVAAGLVAARVVSDPQGFYHYWLGAEALLAIGLVVRRPTDPRWRSGTGIALAYLLWTSFWFPQPLHIVLHLLTFGVAVSWAERSGSLRSS